MGTAEHDLLLRTSEAAVELGVTQRTVLRHIYQGRMRSTRTPGGHYRVPQSEVDRLKEQCKLRTPAGWPL